MSGQPHLIARVLPEYARNEQDKSCHFFPLPAGGGPLPESLRAYCGFHITPGVAEALEGPAGMPCTTCLVTATISGNAG
ncbi:hypothetical protein [Saccharopolyspora sp. CA-218241]|uniref:hypothetical protein n=1 Tax=Saccharopolyspora sp. CA-218241 TaxID=3240027 RepID=UPI003D995C9A